MTGLLRAGQIAASAAVNLQTLRYYERRGLLDPPDRSLGGYRLYSDSAVTRLRVIKTAQRLGFTLAESGTCWKPDPTITVAALMLGCSPGWG